MADNIAGQTRTNSDKQDSPAVARGSVVYDATAITAADSTRVLKTTNGGITVDDKGFRVLQNATLAAILASKTCHYEARG